MTYREFVEHMQGLTTHLVGQITGDRDIVPMVHMARGDGVGSTLFSGDWLEHRDLFIQSLVLPLMEVVKPEFVAWTFTGRRGRADGEWEHETAVAVCIDRERHETWLARLVRHDNKASLGAWRPWPVNDQEGPMLTQIQEALR